MSSLSSMAVLLALCLDPVEHVARERVDLVEINHFYDERGRLVFDQIIFYDWCQQQGEYQVRDWRLLKNPAQLPHRNWPDGDYMAVWHDGEILRQVHARALRESWTQYDPELVNRVLLPKEQRRLLRKMPQPVAKSQTNQRAAVRVAQETSGEGQEGSRATVR